MSIKRPGTLTSPDLAFTYRVRPICGGDLALIRSALAEFAPDWSVELQGFCADEAIIVVVPEDGDDVTGPSFMISRETYGFRVDQVHWDVVTEVGVLASMNAVIDAVRLQLPRCAGLEAPVAVTLH